MPELCGEEILVTLRGEFPGLPIIAMSGYRTDLDSFRTPDEAMICCVVKPVSPGVLVRLVETMLAKGPNGRTPQTSTPKKIATVEQKNA